MNGKTSFICYTLATLAGVCFISGVIILKN